MKIYLVTGEKEWVKPVQESGLGMLFSYYDSETEKLLSMIREDKQKNGINEMKENKNK